MPHIAVELLERTSHRTASGTRALGVALAVLVLMGLSFDLGRVTMGHSGATTPIIRSTVVQPVISPGHNLLSDCRPFVPC
ncbi:MAG: hypothetical protein QOF82_875 [Frankiales bacterium]|jgi:hypothetical protein|nr:hypothetical protein [Frankiales bacterium]